MKNGIDVEREIFFFLPKSIQIPTYSRFGDRKIFACYMKPNIKKNKTNLWNLIKPIDFINISPGWCRSVD